MSTKKKTLVPEEQVRERLEWLTELAKRADVCGCVSCITLRAFAAGDRQMKREIVRSS